METPDYLTTSQVAKMLGVCERTATKMADRGALRVVRAGPPPGRRLFIREDVERKAAEDRRTTCAIQKPGARRTPA